MVLIAEYVCKGGTFGENVVLIVELLHKGAGGMERNARDAGKKSNGVPATAKSIGVNPKTFRLAWEQTYMLSGAAASSSTAASVLARFVRELGGEFARFTA